MYSECVLGRRAQEGLNPSKKDKRTRIVSSILPKMINKQWLLPSKIDRLANLVKTGLRKP